MSARLHSGIAPQHEPYTQWPDTMVCEPVDMPQTVPVVDLEHAAVWPERLIKLVAIGIVLGFVLERLL